MWMQFVKNIMLEMLATNYFIIPMIVSWPPDGALSIAIDQSEPGIWFWVRQLWWRYKYDVIIME